MNTGTALAHLSSVIGADAKPRSLSEFINDIKRHETQPRLAAGTIGGGAAGYFYFKNHRILGAIGGASLGRNLPTVFLGGNRKHAFVNMATTAMAIASSRMVKGHPVLGFVGGSLLGNAVLRYLAR